MLQSKPLHAMVQEAASLDSLLLTGLPEVYEEGAAHVLCSCGFKGSIPVMGASKKGTRAIHKYLACLLFYHVRDHPEWLQLLAPPCHFDNVPDLRASLFSYNKEFELEECQKGFRLTCKVCGAVSRQTHLSYHSTRSYAQLVIMNWFYHHVLTLHAKYGLSFSIQPTLSPLPHDYLYLDIEYGEHFQSPSNCFLLHMATLTPALAFTNLLSVQSCTPDKSSSTLFKHAGEPFQYIALADMRALILERLAKHDYRVVFKDGRLELTFLTLLRLRVQVLVRDLGAGVIDQTPSFIITPFKGNHNNLEKELQSYQPQLQKLAFTQTDSKAQPRLFSAEYCRLFFTREEQWVRVCADTIWKDASF